MRLEHLIADIDEVVYARIMENRTVSEDEGSSYQVRLYVKGSQIRDYSCSCVKRCV